MGSFGAPTLKYTVQLALMVSMFQLSDEPVNTCTLCGVQDLDNPPERQHTSPGLGHQAIEISPCEDQSFSAGCGFSPCDV